MLSKLYFGISMFSLISMMIACQVYKSEIKELQNTVNLQESELTIKKMELEALEKSIEEQNKKILAYQKDTSSFADSINELNTQLEQACKEPYTREGMCKSDSTEKEAMEWIRSKRNSISF